MSDGIVIEIDLDNAKYKKQLNKAQSDTDTAGQEISESLNKNISDTINNSITISIKNMGSTMQKTSKTMVDSAASVAFGVNQMTTAISGAGASVALLIPVAKNFKSISDLAKDLSSILFKGGGLFGFISALGSTSVALFAVSRALESTNNSFLQSIGFVSKLTALLIGGLGAAITFVAIKVADLAQVIGGRLVNFFDVAATLFNKTEQNLDTFRAVVDSTNRSVKGSIGTFRVWESVVGQIADTFNIARDEVRKSAQEILLVGPKLGLVESQMRQLLKVSTEYAKINKKDVFQTTVNFVNALNGNAQAVAALGVKLTQASLQQFAYAKGVTSSIQKLSEQEKVQLRFNKVLSQYKDVAGIGIIAANSLAESSKRLEIQQKRLQASLGEGSRIIEQNNILAFAYDKILSNISGTTAKLAGFFGALGARLIQFGGIFLEISLKTFAVIKGFKLLRALLESDLGIKAFASNIPLLNTSLNQLLTNLTGTQVQIRSLGSLMTALTATTSKAFNSFSQVIFGRGTKGLGVINALTGAVGQLRAGFARLIPAILPFLIPLIKIGLVIGVVIAAFNLLKAAFIEIEKRTGALSEIWNILVKIFNDSKSAFSPVIELFNNITESIKTLVSKGFGLFVSGISGVISLLASLARRNPFGVFSQDTIVRISGIEKRLDVFRDKIASVGFDMRKLGDDSKRSLAGVAEASKINLEELVKTLNSLRERYAQFGLSQVQILQQQQASELEALRASFANKLILENEYLTLRDSLNRDFSEKLRVAREEEALSQQATFANTTRAFIIHAKNMKTTAGELAKTMLDLSVRGFGNAFRSIGASLAAGGNAMQAFVDSVKATFGELAGALGDYYIKQGVARLAAGEPNGGTVLAAGAALKVLSGALGSSSTASGTAGAGGGISAGAGGFQNQETGQITDARAERSEPDTNLVVNIQGDILDGQETGNRIIDVLGNSFSKEGVILRDVRIA